MSYNIGDLLEGLLQPVLHTPPRVPHQQLPHPLHAHEVRQLFLEEEGLVLIPMPASYNDEG